MGGTSKLVQDTGKYPLVLLNGLQGYSVKEFVEACIQVTGAKIKVEYGPRRHCTTHRAGRTGNIGLYGATHHQSPGAY